MALDHGCVTCAGLDHIRVNRTLSQVIHLTDFFGFRLKDPDEFLADDLPFALRLADAGQLAQKQFLRVDPDEVDVPLSEGRLYLVSLIETHEAVVHKYAGQLIAYGLRYQRCRHGGIHAAGEGQQYLAVPHLFPDLTDGNILIIPHGPLPLCAADLIEEVAEHGGAVGGVIHLRVELDAVKAPTLVTDGHVGTGVGMGHQFKALRHLLHIVAVAHPGNTLGRQALEQLAVGAEIGLRLAVLPGGIRRSRRHPAAQIVGDELTAVANAQNGDPQLEDLRVCLRGRGIVHTVGPAGKDNADGGHRLDLRHWGGVGPDLAVYAAFPDPPGDKLIILTSEIEY